MLPDGKYLAVAQRAELIESSKKGTPGVEVDFKITQGELAGEVVPWTGWLSDNSLDRTMSSLRSMGWGGDIKDLSGLDNEVSITVKREEYNGHTSSKVAFVNAIKKPVDGAKLSALEERIKAKASGEVDPFADP